MLSLLSGTVAASGQQAGCGVASKPSVSREDVLKFHPDAPSKIVHTHHAGVWMDTPTAGSLADSAEENNLLAPEALREMLERLLTDEGGSPASLLALREMAIPCLENGTALGL